MIYASLRKKTIIYECFIYFLLFCVLGKLFYIEIINYKKINNLANESWQRSFPLSASRGIIYDNNLNVLASNLASMSLYVIPFQIKDKNACAKDLANILNANYESILKKISKKESIVKIYPEGKNLNDYQIERINALNFEGVYLVYDNKRYYPYDELLASSLGFVGIDNQGLAGIESKYDDYLKGVNGTLNYYLDAKGGIINNLSSSITAPLNGYSLQLTVDLKIQQVLERELENAYLKYSPESIYGIIMNPNNGEILAIASRPTFNLNKYQEYDKDVYNRNLPIWKSYEPGSTFKVFSFAAAINEKAIDMEKDTYYDKGYEYVDGFKIKSWKKGGHGLQTFLEVLENSSNPGFVEISRRLGKEKLYNYVLNFGFSKKTNIDMIGETSGIFFDYEKYNNLENATTSFGQGISVSMIQMARAFSAVINGGILYQPKIVKSILLPNIDEEIFSFPTIINKEDVITKDTSLKMRYALESVVAKGSGRKAYIEGYKIGGKTGTAQIANNGKYMENDYILSYISGFPMDNPQIVSYVCLERPKSVIKYGGTIVGPIIKKINQDIISYLNIKPKNDGIPFEYTWMDIKTAIVENYVGKNINDCKSSNFKLIKMGNGDKVVYQLPLSGSSIEQGKEVILFT